MQNGHKWQKHHEQAPATRSSFEQNVSGYSTQIYTVKNTPTVFLFHNFKNYCSVSCRVFLFANPVNVFETKLNYFCLGHFPPKDILWSNLPRLFSQRINNSPITYPHYDSTFLNESLSIYIIRTCHPMILTDDKSNVSLSGV